MIRSTFSYVPASQYRAHVLEAGLSAINRGWDRKHAEDRAAASASVNDAPLKPPVHPHKNPKFGSRSYLQRENRAGVNRRGAANLRGPVARTKTMESAFAPAINNVGTFDISAMASSLPNAMARGVNPTMEAVFEKMKEFTDATDSAAAPVSREASRNFQNFQRCHLRSLPVMAT